jgi:hypothetical protein
MDPADFFSTLSPCHGFADTYHIDSRLTQAVNKCDNLEHERLCLISSPFGEGTVPKKLDQKSKVQYEIKTGGRGH